MSIIASDIINRAKKIWTEAAATNILDATGTLYFLSDGLLELRSLRPETAFVNGVHAEHVDVTGTTQSIPIDVKFRPCLVDYLTGRGFQADANLENHESRANKHLNDFVTKAKGA
jgi:hypothetical protein